MKSIFILGASMLQVPAIKKAKEKGLFVYVLDYNPDAVGIQYADKFLCISTIDKQAVYEAALEYKPDYIITSTSDMPVSTAAWVNEKLGKKTDISYENSICATNKLFMRDRLKEKGVAIPLYFKCHSEQEFLDAIKHFENKFIVKPCDNAASRGVIFVDKTKENNFSEIYNYSKSFSRSGDILVEEFMEGDEVSVESFTINGHTEVITITDKLVTPLPYFVELGHTEPSRHSREIQKQIQELAINAISAIGIITGPSHTEIKITPNGVKIVEIAARLGGDFITSKLVPLSTGVDLIEASINAVIGEKVDLKKTKRCGSAIRYITSKPGIIKKIENIEEAKILPGIIEIEFYQSIGDTVVELTNSSERVGHVIAIGKDANEAEANCQKAMSLIKISLD